MGLHHNQHPAGLFLKTGLQSLRLLGSSQFNPSSTVTHQPRASTSNNDQNKRMHCTNVAHGRQYHYLSHVSVVVAVDTGNQIKLYSYSAFKRHAKMHCKVLKKGQFRVKKINDI